MYYRLLLPEMLPMEVKRLLYIDADIIINKPLKKVYRAEFAGNEIIATEDMTAKVMHGKRKEMFALMLDMGYQYFNSGFMLLNIEEIRKCHNFQTYIQAMEAWDYQMTAPDQDILNYVHWQKVGYIDCRKYDMFTRIAYNEGTTYEQVKKHCDCSLCRQKTMEHR